MTSPPIHTFQPVAQSVTRYARLRHFHAELWPKLAEWNSKLAAFTED